MEILDQVDQFIYILFGWLLGILGPSIVERIRRKRRETELIAAVVGELRELQYTMAWVAYRLRVHRGLVTDLFLDWFEPIVRTYDGPEAESIAAGHLTELRRIPQTQRRQMHLTSQRPNTGPALKEYTTPFMEALAGEISTCPLELQRRVWRINGQLALFNQQVVGLRTHYERTFDASLTNGNRQIVETNLNEGNEQLAERAQLIAEAVHEVASISGKSSPPKRRLHPLLSKLAFWKTDVANIPRPVH